MIKKIFILSAVVLFAVKSQSQQLMHSLGVTISALYGKVRTGESTSSVALSQSSFCYFPRYNFVEKDNSSVSVGIPLGIGIGVASNSMYDDVGIAFAYDLPLVVDYNIGCKSTSDNEQNFGGYFGVGFGYYKVNISKSQYSDFKGATYGPMVRGGVRIGSTRESWGGHGLTVGVFFKKGMEKDKLKTLGFNVLYDL